MKKALFPIVFLFCFGLITLSNVQLATSEVKNNETNSPLPLPNGIYFLCCEGGNLNLYNLVGDLVGTGPDCGELVGCYKCVLVNSVAQLPPEPNPSNPSESYILAKLNSLHATSGAKHSGSYGEMLTYYFLTSKVKW
jgi:hypothetical protein